MSAFHALMAEPRALKCREIFSKCVQIGALTQEQAVKVKGEMDARAAEDLTIAKAIPPGPPLTEIVKRGYFSELPKAPFQVAAR